MQLGFMNGKGSSAAISMATQMHDNVRVKGKKVFWVFRIWRKLLTGCPEK